MRSHTTAPLEDPREARTTFPRLEGIGYDDACATLAVTADDQQGSERVKLAARKQLAFYGSTPAYRTILDSRGRGDLHLERNRLSHYAMEETACGRHRPRSASELHEERSES